jgi:hypothetical protein
MYKVIRAFFDLTDKNRLYKVGDTYPAEGAKANKKRIEELATGTNRNGKIYIEEISENDVQPPQDDEDADGNEGGNE